MNTMICKAVLCLTAVCAVLSCSGSGLNPKSPADEAAVRFSEMYNKKDAVSIFELFNTDMQQALPQQNTVSFFSDLYSSYGSITGMSAAGSEPPFVLYKVAFERTELLLKFALDDEKRIAALMLEPYEDFAEDLYSDTPLSLPFEGQWFVFWGGTAEADNYHVSDRAQKGAYDFVITDSSGKTFRGSGTQNADYYAYGQKVLSPYAGTVVYAVDGIPDNVPGSMNPYYAPGNSLLLRVRDDEYILIAHLIPGSLTVRAGHTVSAGDVLGLCGNSGNSSEAHIHMHMQNSESMGNAEGIFAPFADIEVNGNPAASVIPVKGSFVKQK